MELSHAENPTRQGVGSRSAYIDNLAFICLYLGAIVLANFSVLWFGQWATIANAFLFIGLDLTTRDRLHEAWRGKHLRRNMALLILAGSALTLALNFAAWRIALASVVAFAVAAVVDTVTYQRTHSITKSNAWSAAFDSLLFPTIAFGSFLPLVTLGQWLAKVAGGWLWMRILRRLGA